MCEKIDWGNKMNWFKVGLIIGLVLVTYCGTYYRGYQSGRAKGEDLRLEMASVAANSLDGWVSAVKERNELREQYADCSANADKWRGMREVEMESEIANLNEEIKKLQRGNVIMRDQRNKAQHEAKLFKAIIDAAIPVDNGPFEEEE